MSERVYISIPLGKLQQKFGVKTAITLPDLVRQTNAFSRKHRPGCTPTLTNSNPKQLFLQYNVKCSESYSDPSGHDVRVQFDLTKVEESQLAKDLDVQVSCTCPAFLYWGAQWNLHQRDGLLGDPRPELVAPTERLDLRGNFVICKHVHAVFERILPSVQHNIVKILREREVERHKKDVQKTPERLHREQERMKKKKEMEKIRNVKNKDIQERLLDALRRREEKRLHHEQDLSEKELGETTEVVERGQPATEAPTEEGEPAEIPTQAPEPEEVVDLEGGEDAVDDLMNSEEKKIEEQHKKHEPHLHKGLPYEPEEEDQDDIMRKFESQH